MSPGKLVTKNLRRLDVGLALAAGLAFAVALLVLLLLIGRRNDAIDTVCRQVRELRTGLVKVLADSERANLVRATRGLTPAQAARVQAQIQAFYGPQIDRVKPVKCP